MMKVIFLATAMAASALAQKDPAQRVNEAMEIAEETKAKLDDIKERLKQFGQMSSGLVDGASEYAESKIVVDRFAMDVIKTAARATAISEAIDTMSGKAEMTMKVDRSVAARKLMLNQMMDQLDSDMTSTVSDLNTGISGSMRSVEAGNRNLDATQKAVANKLKNIKKCAEQGQVFDPNTNKCKGLDFAPEFKLPKVHHRMWDHDDGRDHGYINHAWVKFVKEADDTYIRVYYHDNLRVHGHTAHGKWSIMFCDANGNDCKRCTQPSQIMYWRYGSHQHNWWMNDHWSGSITGLCKVAENRNLVKGTYQVKVYLDSNRYDMYTGHNQRSMIMVDEVMMHS